MKKYSLFLFLAMSVTLVFSSCTNDDDSSSTTNTGSIVQSGTWRISLFSEDGVDETYYFTGYNFTFLSNGTATAVKGSTTVTGTWAAGTDDSQQKLILFFGSSSPFDELDEDWRILQQTDTKIELQDVSGGNGGTDLLTFVRN